MAHVAIDVLVLPPVRAEGKTFDCVVLCVDRHSGWLVAVPEFRTGLTGASVAKAFIKQRSAFGIPTKITTDQGPLFAKSWWRTVCAIFGINHIYTQP